jgi:hypothetical protein
MLDVDIVYNGTIYLFIETVKTNKLVFRGLDMPNSISFRIRRSDAVLFRHPIQME